MDEMTDDMLPVQIAESYINGNLTWVYHQIKSDPMTALLVVEELASAFGYEEALQRIVSLLVFHNVREA